MMQFWSGCCVLCTRRCRRITFPAYFKLKEKKDVALFRTITTDVAKLVKKYKGSLCGEHGDGIVRAEFIGLLIGKKNYQLIKTN